MDINTDLVIKYSLIDQQNKTDHLREITLKPPTLKLLDKFWRRFSIPFHSPHILKPIHSISLNPSQACLYPQSFVYLTSRDNAAAAQHPLAQPQHPPVQPNKPAPPRQHPASLPVQLNPLHQLIPIPLRNHPLQCPRAEECYPTLSPLPQE